MGGWKTAETPEGKKYYWRGKAVQWDEPADYDDGDPWVAAERNGDTYYYHVDTKETAWKHPTRSGGDAQAPQEPQAEDAAAGSGFVAGGRGQRDDYGAPDRRMDRRDGRYADLPQKPSGGAPWEGRYESRHESRHEGRHESRHEGLGFRGPMPMKTDEPEYGSREQNEEAFFKLLRKHDISPDTTWIEAVRQVARERDYRAIKDPLERQQAFEKYCRETREQEKGKEIERQKKLREDFRKMLATHEEIVHYTRWKTARPMIEREAVFKSSKNEEMKRQLFEEYVGEQKRKHDEQERSRRTDAKRDLDSILRALIHDPETTWTAAREMVESNERFAQEEKFRAISKVGILNAFDAHMRTLDRQVNDQKQHESVGKIRRERKARDDFKQLLGQMRASGKIKAGTKWKDFHGSIADDERYHRLLVTHGSSPLDLFWDAVEDEEGLLRTKRNSALDVLEDKRYEMTTKTTLDEFSGVMKSDPKTASFSEHEVNFIFERLMQKIKKRAEEDKAHAARDQRKAIDALRSVIKHLDPPVRVGDTYEDTVPKLESYEEFKVLDDDEARRTAFEKHIRRLKDKEEDLERERTRRDRDHRNGSRRYDDRSDRGDARRRTRSPEQNAYEADRRKAQADRERLHRRGSFGLSPPPRDRRDDDRDRYRDDRYRRRDDRDRHESIYERERREREMERERSYISRADPRDVGIALQYGDEEDVGSGSRPGSVRKRRDSEDSRKRDAKRRRRTPEATDTMLKEDAPELQSGSEEGEIEEV